jgi:hypothetical protein
VGCNQPITMAYKQKARRLLAGRSSVKEVAD